MHKNLALQVKQVVGILFDMDSNIYAISYKMRLELYHRIFSVVCIVLSLFVCITLISKYVIFSVECKSTSMSPDIPAGSLEFVCPLLTTPERGDVILLDSHEAEKLPLVKRIINTVCVFASAQKWIPFEEKPVDGTRPVLRRVVAVPGDTIYIDRYVVFVKPENENHFLTEFEVSSTKYNVRILVPPTDWDVELGAKSSIKKITLNKDEYYVLGDDRLSALDSRVWGPVKKSSIVGKALLVYFPFNKFKLI